MKSRINNRNWVILMTISLFLFLGLIVILKFTDRVKELVPDKKASKYYSEDQYFGIVIDKFIDRDQHNYKTVVIKNLKETRKVLFDFEIGGLYDFIEVGDSISKNINSLDFRLIREDLDTVVQMKIYDRN